MPENSEWHALSLRLFYYEKKTVVIRKYTVEVEVVRVKITLACTECKQRNYNMTRKHTLHKETK